MNKELRNLLVGLAFLLPNILGFLAFTLIPLGMSLAMAFTNWDLRFHNLFQNESIRFVGLQNFQRLLEDFNFWRYLGNTLIFMIGLPLGMIGSLSAALFLSQPLKFRSARPIMMGGAVFVLALSVSILFSSGLSGASTAVLLSLLVGLVFVGGVAFRETLYRTLFYTPHFTAGVATFVLWKKLYNPTIGPVNELLRGPLSALETAGRTLPPLLFIGFAILLAIILAYCLHRVARQVLRQWDDSEIGTGIAWGLFGSLMIALGCALKWTPSPWLLLPAALTVVVYGIRLASLIRRDKRLRPCPWGTSTSGFVIYGLFWLVVVLLLPWFAGILHHFPAAASAGLEPPEWLSDYHWAKPSLIIMALWAAIGSNNMILYLAALSNVPVELEEAAKVDGATAWQKFWHIVWPQLAPVTFFIFIMGVIHGLQGGFEMARVMTKGGPAGSTTTLSYYIYTEGFETGRLGYASAVAWMLFLLVFAITLLNWRFGNQSTDE